MEAWISIIAFPRLTLTGSPFWSPSFFRTLPSARFLPGLPEAAGKEGTAGRRGEAENFLPPRASHRQQVTTVAPLMPFLMAMVVVEVVGGSRCPDVFPQGSFRGPPNNSQHSFLLARIPRPLYHLDKRSARRAVDCVWTTNHFFGTACCPHLASHRCRRHIICAVLAAKLSRLAAKIAATAPKADGHKRAEDKSKATAEAMYKDCTFAPNTVVTKPLTEKILAAKGKQVRFHCCSVSVC